VGEQERGEAEGEQVPGQHQEDVAEHREDQRDDELVAPRRVRRVQRSRRTGEQRKGERLAHVLDPLVLRPDREPVEDRDHRGEGQQDGCERRRGGTSSLFCARRS